MIEAAGTALVSPPRVDSEISSPEGDASDLLLSADIRDQHDLERDVAVKAEKVLTEQADERDGRRLQRTEAEILKISTQQRQLRERISRPAGQASLARLRAELEVSQMTLSSLEHDVVEIKRRIEGRQRHGPDDPGHGTSAEALGSMRLPQETQRDFLIRTGKITPFSKLGEGRVGTTSNLEEVMMEAEDVNGDATELGSPSSRADPLSHQHLRAPGFAAPCSHTGVEPREEERSQSKRRRLSDSSDTHPNAQQRTAMPLPRRPASSRQRYLVPGSDDEYSPDSAERPRSSSRERPTSAEASASEEEHMPTAAGKRKRKVAKSRKELQMDDGVPEHEDLSGVDDGNEALYQARLRSWTSRRSQARLKAREENANELSRAENRQEDRLSGGDQDGDLPDAGEWNEPHPTIPDTHLGRGLYVPGDIYPSLFDYQKTGVDWLSELYHQQVGGIIGDEMGLGKTIQVISFLAALHHSNKLDAPVIVVTPATVMKQWVNEFHRWWPPLRVSILHTSGSGMLNVRGEDRMEQQIDDAFREPGASRARGRSGAAKIVQTVLEKGHVLVTTYAGLQTYGDLLIPINWGYAVLDEGHKIRNPNTAITIYCKELRTPNRVILSGTPMQNNLSELWSLFDFVFPMRLGTLVNFRNQFEIPIKIGGYANATNLQVQTAMKCAETLKDTISPYLLQRLKVDVAADLPQKKELVMFCKMTRAQRQAYEAYLKSEDVKSIMNGKLRSFSGIEKLRKICNHPDLVDREFLKKRPGYNYGSPARSGKMVIVRKLLETFREGGHKTLLFAQQKIVLDILEKYIGTMTGYIYRRMDGDTPIEARQDLVDEFNSSPDIHLFLLTTKVGGLGVNLTGANRVIIFDPDWNPSTDTQARERAWRLGQKREVTIYRLMCHGTIEEKIYHRQLYKQFLANKILKDPKQRQTFPMKDLHDLFTLGSDNDASGSTETGELFKGTETRLHDGAPVDDSSKNPAQSPLGSQSDYDERSRVLKLAGVANLENFKESDEEGGKKKTSAADEGRILDGILASSGVHSTLQHDQIVNGKRVIQGDPKMIEREAKRVAAEAARELKKAGEAARHVPIGTPTWTGEVGVSGRPVQTGRPGVGRGAGRGGGGGPISTSVLAGLQDRQTMQSGSRDSSDASRGNRSNGTKGLRGKDFIRLIRDFLMTHGGEARSQMLVNHFNHVCTTAQQTAEFKEMLHQIAVLHKAGRMRGRWVLKDEYKIR
ncbi:MAG: hypothetical protein M1825_000797 [Sarcosagium campestre]|nr:MAG: hypothetical protein M1825_000797 [Sarcosagium campestre]